MKLCLIYNFAPKYREGIFCKIDSKYDCDWYFGENQTNIKGLDLSMLKRVKTLRNRTVFRHPLYWQQGVLGLLRNNEYRTYFMLGDLYCLSTWAFIFLKKILCPGKHIYFWTHGWYGKEGFVKRVLKRIFLNAVDGIFLYGNYARSLMIENGFSEDRLFVIHNSLNYVKQLEIRRKLVPGNIYKDHFGNDCNNLIFIGRLTAVKRLELLLHTIKILRDRREPYNLTFVGDGEKRSDLEQQVHQLGIDDIVWFYGACYDEEVNAQLIYNADLCVSPGNVGLTAIHSLMFGTPVITHDNFPYQMPEFESIHEGQTGAFYAYNDAQAMANCISQWFKDSASPVRREEIRQYCYKEIDQYWTPEFQLQIINQHLK